MYKLIHSDVLDALKTMEPNSIDVLISDIPYGVSINKNWDKDLPNIDVWNESYRVLKPGSHCIIFGQPSMINNVFSIFNGTDFDYRDMWIWQYQGTHTKGLKLMTDEKLFRSRIRNVFNPIFVFRKKLEGSEKENWLKYKNNLINIDDNREPYQGDHTGILKKFELTGEGHKQSVKKSNTFKDMKRKGWVPDDRGREPVNIKYVGRTTTAEKTIKGEIKNTHETVKPVDLMKWLVGLTTHNEEQIVLDPFCGTGSTGCACKLLNRKFIGIDIDKSYIDIAKFRIDNIEKIFIGGV